MRRKRTRSDVTQIALGKVYRDGRETSEVAASIASVPFSQAAASDLPDRWRGRWGIESRPYRVRDTQFGDDAWRVRTGNAPQVFCGLRSAAVNLLGPLRHTQIAATLRATTVESIFASPGWASRKNDEPCFADAMIDPSVGPLYSAARIFVAVLLWTGISAS